MAVICDEIARRAPAQLKQVASIKKLLRDAAEAALIRDLATDKVERETYDTLHEHFSRLADEVERAMKSNPPK